MHQTKLGAAIFAALVFLISGPASRAQDVTLTSRDGTISVNGTLLSFDGEFYRVDTGYGPLVLDGQGVLCAGPGCPDLEAYVAEVSFSGAPEMGSVLMPALLENYAGRRGLSVRRTVRSDNEFRIVLRDKEAGRDVARVGFRLNSTAEGFADLVAEEADMVMAVREIRANEVALGVEAGLGDLAAPARGRVVALDALVPIVARGNPVTSLTVEDLAAILTGKMQNWPEQGAPIILHARDAASGSQQAVEDAFLAPRGLRFAKLAVRHGSDADVSDAVAADPLALGVVGLSEVGNAVQVMLKGACGIPLLATRRNLKSEDYPFTAPLFLYLPERRLPLFAREFLAYLNGPGAQRVIRRAGFVDQRREAVPWNEQGLRLANAIANAGDEVPLTELQRMLSTLDGAVRLTPTFRFRGGSTALDAQSAGNTVTLARDLEAGVFDDRELIFVGFSDGDGGWEANRKIARQRAEAVRDAVREAAATADLSRLSLSVERFGEAMPMACDDTDWGKRVNRRVEVWLR